MSSEFQGQTLTASQICEVANIGQATFRVWKSRWRDKGIDIFPTSGNGWTRYSFADAMRLTVIVRLAEVFPGVHQQSDEGDAIVLYALKNIRGFKDDDAYFVVSTGALGEVISDGRAKAGTKQKIYMPGAVFPTVVKGRDLGHLLSDPHRYVSIVINLNAVETHVKECWPGDAR